MRYLSAKLVRFVKFGRSKKIPVKRMCVFKLYLDSLLSVGTCKCVDFTSKSDDYDC